jgi:hypothetical protein
MTSVSPPSIPSSLKALSQSAVDLNTATHRLTKSIETLDNALKKLNLGISSWVETSLGGSQDGRFWSREELGYAKVSGKWGLALRASSGDECDTDGEHDTFTEWLFCDASRDMRIRALPHLPQLIAQLNTDAKSVTARISENVKEAEELAHAIELIAQNGSSSLSAEALQQHAIKALSGVKNQDTAVDALSDAVWILEDDTVQIRTELSKTMLPMVINGEATKIIKNAISEHGSQYLKVEILPGVRPIAKGENK